MHQNVVGEVNPNYVSGDGSRLCIRSVSGGVYRIGITNVRETGSHKHDRTRLCCELYLTLNLHSQKK